MSWLSDRFDDVGDLFEGAAEAVADGVTAAGEWVDDLFSGDVGNQPMAVPEFVDKIHAGNSSPWHEAAAQAEATSKSQGAHATSLQEIIAGLESAWTGAGADAARERVNKLRTVAASADKAMAHNQQMVLTAASSFEHARGALKTMPLRPDKSFGDVISPWDTDTEDAINDYNRRARENLEVYKGYEGQLRDVSSGLQGFYGDLGYYDGVGGVVAPLPPGGREPSSGRHGNRDGVGDHLGNAGYSPSLAPDLVSGQPGGLRSDPGSVLPPGHTTTAGFTTVPPSGGQSAPMIPSSSTGASPGGIGSSVRMGGPLSGGAGITPRFGGGEGGGSKSGSGLSAGARSTGALNAASEAERLGGRAGSRVSGGGVPGGTATGWRGGNSEEAGEHIRKYGFEEAPFTVEDIDPDTGYSVVPPTIGS